MALPEFPQHISRQDVQQTPHGSSNVDGLDDTYGYENPVDPVRGMVQTHRRNPALMSTAVRAKPVSSQKTFTYREQEQ